MQAHKNVLYIYILNHVFLLHPVNQFHPDGQHVTTYWNTKLPNWNNNADTQNIFYLIMNVSKQNCAENLFCGL